MPSEERRIPLSPKWYWIFGIFGLFRSFKTCYLQPYIEVVNGIDDAMFQRFLLPLTTYTQTFCLLAVTLYANRIGYKSMIFFDALGQFVSFGLIFTSKWMSIRSAFIANIFSQIIYGISEATSICYHSYTYQLFDHKHHYVLSAFTRSLSTLGHSFASFSGLLIMSLSKNHHKTGTELALEAQANRLNILVLISFLSLTIPVVCSLLFPPRRRRTKKPISTNNEENHEAKPKVHSIRSSFTPAILICIFYFAVVFCIQNLPPKIALLMMKEIFRTQKSPNQIKNMYALMDGISRILCTIASLSSVKLKELSCKRQDLTRFSLVLGSIVLFLVSLRIQMLGLWIGLYILTLMVLTVLLTSLSYKLSRCIENGEYAFVFGIATLASLLLQSLCCWMFYAFSQKISLFFTFAIIGCVLVGIVAIFDWYFGISSSAANTCSSLSKEKEKNEE